MRTIIVVRMGQSLVLFLLAAGVAAAQNSSTSDGKALFEKNCRVCHSPGPENRAPLPEALASLSQAAIITSLETGGMKVQGSTLTPAQRVAVARFLSKDAGVRTTNATPNMCPAGGALNSLAGWNGWGVDLVNSRFQPAKAAATTAQDIPKLKLAWAFRFSDTLTVFGQPTIAGGRLFFRNADRTGYSLYPENRLVDLTVKTPATGCPPLT